MLGAEVEGLQDEGYPRSGGGGMDWKDCGKVGQRVEHGEDESDAGEIVDRGQR